MLFQPASNILVPFMQPQFVRPRETGGGGGTIFITGQTLGTLRNDFTGGVGFKMTVGASPITVTELGCWVVAGNSGNRVLRIRDATSADIGNVTVDATGAPTAAYLYGALGTPVVLSASTDYWILMDVTSSGDQWYSNDTTVTHTAVASIPTGGFFNAGLVNTNGPADVSYGPMSFKYSSP